MNLPDYADHFDPETPLDPRVVAAVLRQIAKALLTNADELTGTTHQQPNTNKQSTHNDPYAL
jgi:hypothetical protein